MTTSQERNSSPSRTPLQVAADATDLTLCRVISAVEAMREGLLQARQSAEAGRLLEALEQLRAARTPLRMLMHRDDRERTTGYV
jgi:hypothetical protein